MDPSAPGRDPSGSGGVLEERPLRELVAQLSKDGGLLLRQEIALAKVELSEKAARLQSDLTSLATGAFVLYAGLLGLMAAVTLLLAEVIPGWAAALVVSLVVTGIGAALTLRSKHNLNELDLKPRKAAESVRKDVGMLKEAARDQA
jgi:hypothetical protein